jgi:hypothetical protein
LAAGLPRNGPTFARTRTGKVEKIFSLLASMTMATVGMSSRICAKSLKLLGAGEALRFKSSDRFFVLVSGSYEQRSIFVLDVLLDVLLDVFIGSVTKGSPTSRSSRAASPSPRSEVVLIRLAVGQPNDEMPLPKPVRPIGVLLSLRQGDDRAEPQRDRS